MTLKERRKALGLTQIQMAVRCSVSLTAYRMWEEGMNQSKENRRKLEEVLSGDKDIQGELSAVGE